jgi:hypothetical protein
MSSFSPHAISRFFERTDLEVTRNQIMRAIEGGNIAYAKRLSASRSLAYTLVGENVVKLIIAKSSKKVISIIPWKSIFKKIITCQTPLDIHKGTHYEVILFPDCYMETNCKHALTKISRIHKDGAREPINFNHPDFDVYFDHAWGELLKDNDHIEIQKRRESGNEKIETQSSIRESTAA